MQAAGCLRGQAGSATLGGAPSPRTDRRFRRGAVAHLGERFNGIEEVGGSSPPSSTNVSRTHNSALQGDLGCVSPAYGTVLRGGYGVVDRGLAGPDLDLPDERLDEGPRLGELAGPQELAHVLREGRDRLHLVQRHPALPERRPRILRCGLQLLLALPVLPDAVRGVGHLYVGGLDDLPDAAQPPLHLLQLLLDDLQPLALLSCHPVHLLVHDLHQVSDVGLG